MKSQTLHRSLAAIFSVSFFLSCGNAPKIETVDFVPPMSDSAPGDSKEMNAEDFHSVLLGISISNINQFIHPEKGLWLVQSSGAMPEITNTSQVDKNFPVDFSGMKFEDVPKVDCDAKSFWTKAGCFAQEADLFSSTEIWEHSNLSKEDKDKVVIAARTVQWTVVNTSLHVRCYFSKINGKWYLSFMDLRKPCQA